MNVTTQGCTTLSSEVKKDMPLVVGVRFRSAGKIYYFDPIGVNDLVVGEWTVVETAQGCEMGRVVLGPHEVEKRGITGKLRPVQRRATAADALEKQRCETRAQEALERCRAKVAEYRLPMKIVHAEYSFDGRRLLFFFSSEKRVDFRDLVKDLAKVFRTRIELRHIGVRDEARLMGGIGRCGRQICCSAWLSNFSPVSIKMAKQQGLPLSPMEISGLCGRLLCCLSYENEYYREVSSRLPKRGKKVDTPQGRGVVKAIRVLKEAVAVKLESGETVEVTFQELEDMKSEARKEPQRKKEEKEAEKKEERAKPKDRTKEQPKAPVRKKRRRRRPRRRRPRRQDGSRSSPKDT